MHTDISNLTILKLKKIFEPQVFYEICQTIPQYSKLNTIEVSMEFLRSLDRTDLNTLCGVIAVSQNKLQSFRLDTSNELSYFPGGDWSESPFKKNTIELGNKFKNIGIVYHVTQYASNESEIKMMLDLINCLRYHTAKILTTASRTIHNASVKVNCEIPREVRLNILSFLYPQKTIKPFIEYSDHYAVPKSRNRG